MTSATTSPRSEIEQPNSATSIARRAERVFITWCFGRELKTVRHYRILLEPLVICGVWMWSRWQFYGPRFVSTSGPSLFRDLTICSILALINGAISHASKAVCWETSREFRDLIRLTGLSPLTLLWSRTLAHWSTILFSLFLLLPLAMFIRTLGGISMEYWVVAGCWILLATVLLAGFAMMAGVSSRHASKPEAAAPTSLWIMLIVYHLLFWGTSAVILIVDWVWRDFGNLPQSSFGAFLASMVTGLAPANSFYRAISDPDAFSILWPGYWMHFLTAALAIWASTIVIRNQFKVTTIGDSDTAPVLEAKKASSLYGFDRPRCGEKPFVWKDYYVLGSGSQSQTQWVALNMLAIIGVIASVFYGTIVIVAPVILLILPCLVVVRFDGLLGSEFREKTWGNLMLLPVDPRVFIISKLRVALWERRWLMLPAVTAAVIAGSSHPTNILIVTVIALCVFILLVEFSVLAQLNSKKWWNGPCAGIVALMLMAGNAISFARHGEVFGTVTTGTSSLFVACICYLAIHRRLSRWSED